MLHHVFIIRFSLYVYVNSSFSPVMITYTFISETDTETMIQTTISYQTVVEAD